MIWKEKEIRLIDCLIDGQGDGFPEGVPGRLTQEGGS